MEISELQKDLAAIFRWTARLNMNEGIANHFSVCLPNSNDFYVSWRRCVLFDFVTKYCKY